MDLKDMQLSKADQSSYGQPGSVMGDSPEYPYGLQISLDTEAIAKLGLVALPGVGQTMMLYARVEVCSVSEYESDNGKGKERSVGLQITQMALGADQQSKNPESLYGG